MPQYQFLLRGIFALNWQKYLLLVLKSVAVGNKSTEHEAILCDILAGITRSSILKI